LLGIAVSGDTLLKHSRMPKRMSIERRAKRAKSQRGHAGGLPVSIERRNEIIEKAKYDILNGKTIDQIAGEHGIAPRTLDYWLHGLGDEYEELRRAWIDGMLTEAGEELKAADDPLRLARARELQRRAQWYAERRDRKRYGEDRNVTVNVSVDRGERLRRAWERVIDVVPEPQSHSQLISANVESST
jgi:transposase-like protein